MALKFKTAEDRDVFAKRLSGYAWAMLRSQDQGGNHTIYVTPTMIDDIRAASAIVAASDIAGKRGTDDTD